MLVVVLFAVAAAMILLSEGTISNWVIGAVAASTIAISTL